MAKRSNFLKIIGKALSATVKNLPIALIAASLYGVLLAVLDRAAFAALGVDASTMGGGQSEVVKAILSMLVVQFSVEIFLGPVLGAMVVYVGRQEAAGKASSVYQSINFALNRYKRLIWPHFVAWLNITLGMIIVVPGVLFLLQYAFVDAVACMEEEQRPLARSKRLTRGRRKSLFLIILPWIMLSQVMGFFQLWALSQAGWIMIIGDIGAALINFVMFLAFYFVYDERTRKKRAKLRG